MTNRIPNEQIMAGTIELADIEDIARTFEAKGAEREASKWQDSTERAFCWGFASCVALQIAALLVRAGIHAFNQWWAWL